MPGVLGDVHGSVSGAEQAVARCAVFGVKRYADASGAMQDVAFDGKRLFEATLQPSAISSMPARVGTSQSTAANSSPPSRANRSSERSWRFMRMSNLLQVEVADLVAIKVVDQLELIRDRYR